MADPDDLRREVPRRFSGLCKAAAIALEAAQAGRLLTVGELAILEREVGEARALIDRAREYLDDSTRHAMERTA